MPATMAALLPFPLFSSAADGTSSKDIVSLADSSAQLTTLVAALEAAGLTDALKGAGPMTLLAPTDAAFAKLPAGILDAMLKPEGKEKLLALLTYHVVAGNMTAAAVMTMSSVTTLNGQSVTLTLSGNKVKINDATIIKADAAASNGTVHVIDAVLLPK
jgi:uncharacterized surface protein with fasciclin (FAS1) repeats